MARWEKLLHVFFSSFHPFVQLFTQQLPNAGHDCCFSLYWPVLLTVKSSYFFKTFFLYIFLQLSQDKTELHAYTKCEPLFMASELFILYIRYIILSIVWACKSQFVKCVVWVKCKWSIKKKTVSTQPYLFLFCFSSLPVMHFTFSALLRKVNY